MRAIYGLVAVPALVGTFLAAVAYLSDGTGVTGTVGALLALIGAVAVTLGALLAVAPTLSRWLRRTLNVLLALGAALTAVAAYFLMQTALTAAMALTFFGLVVAILVPDRRRLT